MRLIISIAILAVSALPRSPIARLPRMNAQISPLRFRLRDVLAANLRWMKTTSSLRSTMRSARMERDTTSSLICKCG